jgi:hypothetical protein
MSDTVVIRFVRLKSNPMHSFRKKKKKSEPQQLNKNVHNKKCEKFIRNVK